MPELADSPAVNGSCPLESYEGSVELGRLRLMMLIRRFEERTYQEYTKPGQRIGGFCHLYSGQEALAVAIASVFDRSRDYLINGYRDHGHSLALGMSPSAAMAEMFGRKDGCSQGKGGSMHLFSAKDHNMGGHGIVGGQIPVGAGMAFACKYKATGGVSFAIFGDGAINQGTFSEALNLASLWKLPAIFMVENNQMAMGTSVDRASAEKDLAKRGHGYNLPCVGFDGNDVDEAIKVMTQAVNRGRAGKGPTYLMANTYRFRGHSMSDAMKYRSKEEMDKARKRDPITMYEQKLRGASLLTDALYDRMDDEVRKLIDESVRFADASPHPEPGDLFTHILSETYPFAR